MLSKRERIVVALAAVLFALAPAAARAHGTPGRGTQGYLGVDLRDVTDEQVSALKLKETRGAEVIYVDHDGPACKAGFLLHDVILQMNGQVIEGEEQLRRMLRETPAGRQVTFLISRDGQQRTLTVQMANREEVERKAWEQHYTVPEPADDGSPSSSAYTHAGNSFFKSSPATAATGATKGTHTLLGTTMIVSAAYTGAKLEVMGPQLAEFFGAQGAAGLLVRSVDPNSPASDAGLKAGDVVIKVNSIPVTSGNEWAKTIHENRGHPVNVVVLRDKKETTLTMTPDAKKRSSLERRSDIEEFFGFGNDASATRATLAQLEPAFNQLADTLEYGTTVSRVPPELQEMIDRLQNVRSSRETLESARLELHFAAVAMQRQLSSPFFQRQMY